MLDVDSFFNWDELEAICPIPCIEPRLTTWEEFFNDAVGVLASEESNTTPQMTATAAPETKDPRMEAIVTVALHPSIKTTRQLAATLQIPQNNFCLAHYFSTEEWDLFINKKYLVDHVTIESHPVKQALAIEVCQNLNIFPENLVILHFYTLNRFYAAVKNETDVSFKRFH